MKRERTIKKWVKQTIMGKKNEILYIKVYKFIVIIIYTIGKPQKKKKIGLDQDVSFYLLREKLAIYH